MSYIATIVIPVRMQNTFSDGTRRLRKLLQIIPNQFEIVVIDDGSKGKPKELMKHLTQNYDHVSYYYLNTKRRKFSLSRARNYGAKVAKTDVVIFHDVDFFATTQIYESILNEISSRDLANDPSKFFCIPVAFLTDEGTQQYRQDYKNETASFDWSFINHPNEPSEFVQFIVQGSSCIALNKKHLLEIGGHDERYTGHGAEDFELLHRLGQLFPIAQLPPFYSENTGSGFIREYKGFRAYFALYGKACKEQGIVLVHLYHPKRAIKGYYNHKKNFKLLKKLMEEVNG